MKRLLTALLLALPLAARAESTAERALAYQSPLARPAGAVSYYMDPTTCAADPHARVAVDFGASLVKDAYGIVVTSGGALGAYNEVVLSTTTAPKDISWATLMAGSVDGVIHLFLSGSAPGNWYYPLPRDFTFRYLSIVDGAGNSCANIGVGVTLLRSQNTSTGITLAQCIEDDGTVCAP